MTEDEARQWLDERDLGSTKIRLLERYAQMLIDENQRQNLLARSTLDLLWGRHIVDSVQLHLLLPESGRVADLGSGPGLPGIVLAILGHEVTLIEPRKRRCDFLLACKQRLELPKAEIQQKEMERATGCFNAITARALGSMSKIFDGASHLAAPECRWVLPRGESGTSELETVQQDWSGVFHVERSVTDHRSSIIIATDVRRRAS